MNPDEIRHKKFTKRLFGGVDLGEVSAYIQALAEVHDSLDADNAELRRELAKTRQDLAEYHSREQSLEQTLAQTRDLAREIKQNAEKEAQLIVAEAELQAEKILGQTHNRLAQIHDDISELKRQRAQFEVRLRSLVEAHLKLLDVEGDRDRDLADLEDKIKILRAPNHQA